MRLLLLFSGFITFICGHVSSLPEQNQWTAVLKSRRDVFNLTRSLYVNSTIYLHVACQGKQAKSSIKYFVGFVELPCLSAALGNVSQYKYVEDGMGDDNDYRMLRWQTVVCTPTVNKLPVMKGGPGTVYTTIKDSVFFLTIKILEPSPATILYGTLYTRRADGNNLSPIDWPLLPFYSVSLCVDVLYALVWLLVFVCCCLRSSHSVHYIHRSIAAVIALGIMEHAVLLSAYSKLNRTSTLVVSALVAGEILSCVKRTLSRAVFIVVSLHTSTVSMKLGVTCRLLSVTGVYLTVSCLAAVNTIYMAKYNESPDVYRTMIMLYVVDAFICLWIYRNLSHAISDAASAGKSSQSNFYSYLSSILALSVTGSACFLAWSIDCHLLPECITEWRTLWLDEAFWHILFEVDLLLVMFVCRPTSASAHHSSQLLLLDSDDDVTQHADS